MINTVKTALADDRLTLSLDTDAGKFEVKIGAGPGHKGILPWVALTFGTLRIELVKSGQSWTPVLVECPGLSWPADKEEGKKS